MVWWQNKLPPILIIIWYMILNLQPQVEVHFQFQSEPQVGIQVQLQPQTLLFLLLLLHLTYGLMTKQIEQEILISFHTWFQTPTPTPSWSSTSTPIPSPGWSSGTIPTSTPDWGQVQPQPSILLLLFWLLHLIHGLMTKRYLNPRLAFKFNCQLQLQMDEIQP